jgi:hypothetical protein
VERLVHRTHFRALSTRNISKFEYTPVTSVDFEMVSIVYKMIATKKRDSFYLNPVIITNVSYD